MDSIIKESNRFKNGGQHKTGSANAAVSAAAKRRLLERKYKARAKRVASSEISGCVLHPSVAESKPLPRYPLGQQTSFAFLVDAPEGALGQLTGNENFGRPQSFRSLSVCPHAC